jgi:hypothetical protein
LSIHQNWIAAEPAEPLSGEMYALRAPGPDGENLGQWPNSGASDLERAFLACGEAPALSRADLRQAGQELTQAPDPSGAVGAAYDLSAEEFEEYTEPLEEDLLALLGGRVRHSVGQAAAREVLVLRVHWSAGPLELWTRWLRNLALGRPTLVLPDAALAPAAERLAQCLAAVGGASAAWSVLHLEGQELERVLGSMGGSAEIQYVGPAHARAAFLERQSQARRELLAGAAEPFGSGVEASRRGALGQAGLLELSELVVHAGDDPEKLARRVARLAFGRDWALGGWDAQALRRVQLDPRVMSRFTACLLGELEQGKWLDSAPWPMRRKLQERLLEARERGLGEGATLIHQGLRPSRPGASGVILTRLVFTNVEPRMGLSALQLPAPLLLLERLETKAT